MDRENQQETVSDIELGWFVGMLEAEGSIVLLVSRRKDRTRNLRVIPRAIMTNTDQGVIDKYIDILTRLGIGKHVRRTAPNNTESAKRLATSYQDITYVTVQGMKRMHKLLTIITPHMMSEKKKRAEILLSFISTRLHKSEVLGLRHNMKYDREDVDYMIRFLKLTRSKRTEKVAGLLREYTQGKQYQKRLKRYSELMRKRENQSEMVGRQHAVGQ